MGKSGVAGRHGAGTCSPARGQRRAPIPEGRPSTAPPGGPRSLACPGLPVLLLQRARGRLLPLCPQRLGQVEISPFKPARANQGPARRRFKGVLQLASRLAAATLASGAGEPLLPGLLGATQTPRVTGALALARRSGAATMERSLHRVSLETPAAPSRACPSISPPLVKCIARWLRSARMPREGSSLRVGEAGSTCLP